MSSPQVSNEATNGASGAASVPLRFEVIVLPVADVDRAKAFYTGLGWRLDADFPVDEHYRVVQLTPPGSAASIEFGTGLTTMAPGSAEGMYLIVEDVAAARDDLISRGAVVSEIWHGRGLGDAGHEPGPDPQRASYRSFASSADPDGNRWLMQEITERLPGRLSQVEIADLAALLKETSEHHGVFRGGRPAARLVGLVCRIRPRPQDRQHAGRRRGGRQPLHGRPQARRRLVMSSDFERHVSRRVFEASPEA